MEEKKYYKTVGDMLSHAFAEMGYKDDEGNPITPEGPAMTKEEYDNWKKEMLEDCLEPFLKFFCLEQSEGKPRCRIQCPFCERC